MASCLICSRGLGGEQEDEYHAKCTKWLFGTRTLPDIRVDPSQLHVFGMEMAGHVSLSGVQRKVGLGWSSGERKTLLVAAGTSAYILKPATQHFPDLPENEHLCLSLAREVGIDVPEAGLIRLSDGRPALILKRFDRTDEGERLPMEDFCQLARKAPAHKYTGSAELCGKLVQRYSDAPILDLRALFRQFFFSWWIGNGDLHLKNLSLLSREINEPRLSPAYDLVNTALYITPFEFALPLEGKQRNLGPGDWLRFSERLRLPPKTVAFDARDLRAKAPELRRLIRTSHLPQSSSESFESRIATEEGTLLELEQRALRSLNRKGPIAGPHPRQ